MKKNDKEIEASLNEKFQCIPNYRTILKILDFLRHIIAEYLKYSYKLKQIGGDSNENRIVLLMKVLYCMIMGYNNV